MRRGSRRHPRRVPRNPAGPRPPAGLTRLPALPLRGAAPRSLRLAELDGYPDERPVLGPGPVVVLHVRLPEQFMQHEPRVGAALADPAVGDGVLAEVQARLALVQRTQFVVRLEGAVVVCGLGPAEVLR